MIRYQDNLLGVAANKLKGFFVGWINPQSPETHVEILKNSDFVILAIDDKSDNVIGFITAITDHVLCAYIPLLEVLPEYQGRKIGVELVDRMLKKLDSFYAIDLQCDPELLKFYEKFNMKQTTGMMIRNYDRQSGQ